MQRMMLMVKSKMEIRKRLMTRTSILMQWMYQLQVVTQNKKVEKER